MRTTPTTRRPRTHTRLRRGAALACVGVLLGTSAACGIPGDDGPRVIDQEQIPDDGASANGGSGDGNTALATLYFATPGDTTGRLVTVQREVPTGSQSSPTASTVLENLLLGKQDGDEPADGEALDNIVTLIPPQTQLASPPELSGGVLTVDLSSAINGVQGEGARTAYGQLVCTADALDDVEGVVFTIDGAPVSAPTAEENSSEPLTCESYAGLGEPTAG